MTNTEEGLSGNGEREDSLTQDQVADGIFQALHRYLKGSRAGSNPASPANLGGEHERSSALTFNQVRGSSILPAPTNPSVFTKSQINPRGLGRMNSYSCPDCLGITWSIHLDDPPGVTPMIVECRATPDCKGHAESQFYPATIPDPPPAAHIEWIRPTARGGLKRALKMYPARHRPGMKQHFDQGGALPRYARRPGE